MATSCSGSRALDLTCFAHPTLATGSGRPVAPRRAHHKLPWRGFCIRAFFFSGARVSTLAVIPARLGATRLPSKPLRLLGGLPLILRVWEHVSAMRFADRVVV